MSTKSLDELIIIGGAEDKKNDMKILKYVVSKIKDNELMLISAIASECREDVIKEYFKVFKSLGVKNIKELLVESRSDCNDNKKINLVNEAKLIFFTGGDQLRITSILGGTKMYDALKATFKNGCIYVGTSAGASVVSEIMIGYGEDDKSPSKSYVSMCRGLGLMPNVIFDQHFAQRGRTGRLLSMIAQNPENTGIGIDEDTAVVINNQNILKVIGSGAIYIVDGRDITYSNVSEQRNEELLSMYDVKLHVLTPGKKYNLKTKRPFEEDF